MRCSTCAPINIDALRYGTLEHHKSLSALEDSAAAGCDLCALLRKCINQFRPVKPQPDGETTLILEGFIFDQYHVERIRLSPDEVPAQHIEVSSRDEGGVVSGKLR